MKYLLLLLFVITCERSAFAANTTPAGSNGQIQYNNNGRFGGLSDVPPSQGGTSPINLATLGLPTGGDDLAEINAALADAKTSGQMVYAPCGTYKYNGLLLVDSVRFYGDGNCTILQPIDSSSNPNLAVELTGTSPELDLVYIKTTWVGARVNHSNANTVWVNQATNFKVHDLTAEGAASLGIGYDYSTGGEVYSNIVRDSLADGILGQHGSSYVSSHDNIIYSAGDTCDSVSAYNDGSGQVSNVTITNDKCYSGVLTASGYTACGGQSIIFSNDEVYNLSSGSALYVFGGGSSNCLSSQDITFSNMIVDSVGDATHNSAGIDVVGFTPQTVSNVIFDNIILKNIYGSAVKVGDFVNGTASSTSNITFTNLSVDQTYSGGSSADAVDIFSGSNILFENPNFMHIYGAGIIATPTFNSGFIKVLGGNFNDLNQHNDAVGAIILANSGFNPVHVQNNTQKNGANSLNSFITITSSTQQFISNNIGDVTAVTYSGATSGLIIDPNLTYTNFFKGVTTPVVAVGTVTPIGVETIQGDATGIYASDNGQLIISGNASPLKRLGLMMDTTNNVGKIQAAISGTGGVPLQLNPGGGYVTVTDSFMGLGTSIPVAQLDVRNGSCPQLTARSSSSGAAYFGVCQSDTTGTLIYDNYDFLAFGAPAVAGTPAIIEYMRLTAGGKVGIGTMNPNALLDVNSSSIIIEQSLTPADNAACTAGTIWWDTGFIYICTASGTVKRSTLSTY